MIPQISSTAQTTGMPAITPGLRFQNSATADCSSGMVATEVTSDAPCKSSAMAIRIMFSRAVGSNFEDASNSFRALLNVISSPRPT